MSSCLKILLLLPILSLTLWACKQVDKRTNATDAEKSKEEALRIAQADTLNLTDVEWLDSIDRSLGKLKAKKSVDIIWRFKNVGNKPLIIDNATASCGCTVPEKPEKPIAPGEQGIIKATFNGSGEGSIRKEVHVIGNLKPNREITLSFSGQIDKK
ncbi:MAG: DUF1573 domain-containing protein [Bacteroidetes bacterium]|nr:DUF1573 domain-containing protein [Bacteroidota bacterium]